MIYQIEYSHIIVYLIGSILISFLCGIFNRRIKGWADQPGEDIAFTVAVIFVWPILLFLFLPFMSLIIPYYIGKRLVK